MNPVIYRIMDGKIGHERQSEGLANALSSLTGCTVVLRPALSFWAGVKVLLGARKYTGPKGIVIGAGHKTHWSLIVYRFKYGFKSIVIMKPSLPRRWFNYCIIPYHDKVTSSSRVISSEGAMNVLSLMPVLKEDALLILIGGPSAHCLWHDELIYEQLEQLLGHAPYYGHITLTTSRRTPTSFLVNLPAAVKARVTLVPFDTVPSDWLVSTLLAAKAAWVTQESISMVYEALSAQCVVHLLHVAAIKGKIAYNIDRLVVAGYIQDISHGPHERPVLNESLRIAQLLITKGVMNAAK